MWVLGILAPLAILGIIIATIVAIVRFRGEGKGIDFPSVLTAYAALVVLVCVFLIATGASLLLKAGLAEAFGRDFSYEVPAVSRGVQFAPTDESDARIRDDIATGISLLVAGSVLVVPHAFGAVALRRRGGASARQIVDRSFNLLGLATATLAFLAAGATALNDVLRRYVVAGAEPEWYDVRHPGEPLSITVTMLPLALWFGWRVWSDFAGNGGRRAAPDADVPPLGAAVTAS
jgi:hypothetical protein